MVAYVFIAWLTGETGRWLAGPPRLPRLEAREGKVGKCLGWRSTHRARKKTGMAVETAQTTGAVDVRKSPYARWQALPSRAVTIQGGFWARRQSVNRDVGLAHGYRMLEQAGNLSNLRIAAGRVQGHYQGPVFMDSDVYKWLEALAYEMMRRPAPQWQQTADDVIELVRAAQQNDGYLNSYYTVAEPENRWTDIAHGHEMYCAGHLFQAAVAVHRARRDDRLLQVARRLADHIDATFGPGRRIATPGHPEIEMALVELYRETGEARYLRLAQFLVQQRGHGLLGPGRYNSSAYYQDRVPVREASTLEGHAVRAMYLATGVADIYLETGDRTLLDALERQWQDMVAGKMYITGGLGSRHLGEAFGQPYELPSEAAYCETCATIGSIHWNWRMLLATGEARFADLMERAFFNGFLSGVSLDGSRFFYVNPLTSQGSAEVLSRTTPERMEWHQVACCPPNVMRTLASLDDFFATSGDDGVQIHQYAPIRLAAETAAGGRVVACVETDHPWDGRVVLRIEEAPAGSFTVSLRIPSWAEGTEIDVNGSPAGAEPRPNTYVSLTRTWQTGDRVEMRLDMGPWLIAPHPRIESSRGHLAIERGPIVYCIEQADQGSNHVLDLELDPRGPLESVWRSDLLGGLVQIKARGFARDSSAWQGHLYERADRVGDGIRAPTDLVAIPYYAWANRGAGAMRVWIPRGSNT